MNIMERLTSVLSLCMLCAATASDATERKEPHIGYLYPAGGRQGTAFSVVAGGQLLKDASAVLVSGQGVRAEVIRYYEPLRPFMPDQRLELIRQLVELKRKRLAEMPGRIQREYLAFPGENALRKPPRPNKAKSDPKGKTGTKEERPADAPVALPAHPLLENLDQKNLREIYHVANTFLNFRELKKKQLNRQLMELVLIKVTIDPNAVPGDRELRMRTPLGLTTPICFQVGTLPEICELEPNDTRAFSNLPEAPALQLPVVINGQVLPGDVDRFSFHARGGEKVVIQVDARRLIPFLADAVPGWFQAAISLYDAHDREVAFADDYQFRPDPVLFFQAPADGEYRLEIRDAIYRGREDFVYRISVGALPFVTRMFPLGGQVGTTAFATLGGWHLSQTRFPFDTAMENLGVTHTFFRQGHHVANEIAYSVDALPEGLETEPNDTPQTAQRIVLPLIVNGRIQEAGDSDVFCFEGRSGDEVVAEVVARRLYSPLDSLLRLRDASGHVLAWNDDHVQKEGTLHRDMGILTHHADSYLSTRLPRDGTYFIHLTDARQHGDQDHAYRLRISSPQPDFSLCVTPASLNIPPSGVVEFTAHVLRKDGFQGEIELSLKDAPEGLALSGARIPAHGDRIRMTLSSYGQRFEHPIAIRMEGRARMGVKTLTRPAMPAEDVMQAFLWRHLAPAQELMLVSAQARATPRPVQVLGPVNLPVGGKTTVQILGPRQPPNRSFTLALKDPPPGIALENVRFEGHGARIDLVASKEAPKAGYADNLIIEVLAEFTPKMGETGEGKAKAEKRSISMGVLPAIPFQIVPGPKE